MTRPECSIIIRCRNEFPVILGTLHSFLADLEFCGLSWEMIVVDNMSDDLTADIIEDKYRRWIRAGLLRVIRFSSRASTWGAINAGFAEARGHTVFVADAHVSIKPGTLGYLHAGVQSRGGLWHAPVQKWGDTDSIRTYGYDLKLAERFWGDPCQHKPEGVDEHAPWPIPMAGACLYGVSREQAEEFGLYEAPFRAYGGGEPYLCMKWWMLGSGVYMDPRGLCRHAFGWRAKWKTATKERRSKSKVMLRSGDFTHDLKVDDEYLSYEPGYQVDNEDFYFNFMLAAALVGGREWLDHMAETFRSKFRDQKVVDRLVGDVWQAAAERHSKLMSKVERSLNELLRNPPWRACQVHPVVLPEFVTREN